MNLRQSHFDEKALMGWNSFDKIFSDQELTERDREKAKLALTLASHGTRRMSAETNRAAVVHKIVKETGKHADIAVDVIFESLGIASGQQRPALAASEQSPSEPKKGKRGAA